MKFTGQESSSDFVDEMLVDEMDARRLGSDIADRFQQVISKNPTDDDLASYDSVLKTASNLPYLWDDVVDSMSE